MKQSVDVSTRVIGRNVSLAKSGKIEKYETSAFADEHVQFHITDRAFQYLEQLTVSTLAPHTVKREDRAFRRFQAYARSLAWRASSQINLGRIPVFYDDSEYDELLNAIVEQKATHYFEMKSIQKMLAISVNVTLEERVSETLLSFYELIQKETDFKHFPYRAFDEHGKAYFRKPNKQGVFEYGLTWACIDEECHFVYEHLLENEYIVWNSRRGPALTGKGYEQIERLRSTEFNSLTDIFVIQKYDKERNRTLRTLFNEIEAELKIEVRAVWDDEHIEKIDERILRKITNARAVILDIASDRFNVGLEAGYALAQGKPIIAIMEKDKGSDEIKPPFDIATLNCYGYSLNDLETLKKVLIARIQVALGI